MSNLTGVVASSAVRVANRVVQSAPKAFNYLQERFNEAVAAMPTTSNNNDGVLAAVLANQNKKSSEIPPEFLMSMLSGLKEKPSEPKSQPQQQAPNPISDAIASLDKRVKELGKQVAEQKEPPKPKEETPATKLAKLDFQIDGGNDGLS